MVTDQSHGKYYLAEQSEPNKVMISLWWHKYQNVLQLNDVTVLFSLIKSCTKAKTRNIVTPMTFSIFYSHTNGTTLIYGPTNQTG